MITAATEVLLMIRLTLLLLAGIGATLSVAGRDTAPSGPAAPAGAAMAEAAAPAPNRLALDDEAGAIARALEAAQAHGADETARATLWNAVAATGAAPAPAPADRADRADTPALPVFRVNATRVNLRAGPSTANRVVDQVARDQRVEVLDTDPSGWARIHVPESGLTAWIFDRFLTPAG